MTEHLPFTECIFRTLEKKFLHLFHNVNKKKLIIFYLSIKNVPTATPIWLSWYIKYIYGTVHMKQSLQEHMYKLDDCNV